MFISLVPHVGQRQIYWAKNVSEKDQSSSGRRVQFEMFFTLPDFSDISLRDYQETMQRPFFSLSKKKRLKPIEYLSPDKSVTVHVSANPAYGMATIWETSSCVVVREFPSSTSSRNSCCFRNIDL